MDVLLTQKKKTTNSKNIHFYSPTVDSQGNGRDCWWILFHFTNHGGICDWRYQKRQRRINNLYERTTRYSNPPNPTTTAVPQTLLGRIDETITYRDGIQWLGGIGGCVAGIYIICRQVLNQIPNTVFVAAVGIDDADVVRVRRPDAQKVYQGRASPCDVYDVDMGGNEIIFEMRRKRFLYEPFTGIQDG
jgi:hypothetical protein